MLLPKCQSTSPNHKKYKNVKISNAQISDSLRNEYKYTKCIKTIYVEPYDFTIHKTDNMFFVTGSEQSYFKTDKIEIPLAIRTIRIFILYNGNRRQIHHHGSIDNPN